MFIRKYNNFDEMFYELNREIILNPKLMGVVSNVTGIVNDMILETNSYDCNIELEKLAYTKSKWKHLLRTYMNQEDWCNFKEKIKTTKSLSTIYYFNQKKNKYSSRQNDNMCLISIVFIRDNRRDKFNRCVVYYRITELERKFAPDLIMINKIINELQETCDIKNIKIIIPQGFIHSMWVNGVMDYFDIDRSELDYNHPWIKKMNRVYEKYFKNPNDHQITTYSTLTRLQNYHFNHNENKINIKELSITNFFEKEKK